MVAVVSSFPQFTSRVGRSQVASNARTTTNPGATGNPYGPKAYGPGLNNPYAFPPNQFQIQRALNLANARPGLLVVSLIYHPYGIQCVHIFVFKFH